MATYSSSLRSGLPRVEGGDPWPPEGTIGEPVEPGATFEAEEPDENVAEVDDPTDATVEDSAEVESEDTGAEAAVEDSAELEDSEGAEVVEDSESAEDSNESGPGAGAAVAAGVGGAGIAAGAAGAAAAGGSDDVVSDAVAEDDVEVPLRRGLPRVEGGEPWPPEGFAPAGVKSTSGSSAASEQTPASVEESAPVAEESADAAGDDSSDASTSAAPAAGVAAAGAGAAVGTAAVASGSDADAESAADHESAADQDETQGESAAEPAPAAVSESAAEAAPATAPAAEVSLRRGLPRVEGGDPWPPEGFAPAGVKSASTAASAVQSAPAAAGGEESAAAPAAAEQSAGATDTADTSTDTESSSAAPVAAGAVAAGAAGAGAAVASGSSDGELSDVPLRRGLPRTAGGDPWPPEGFAPASAVKSASAGGPTSAPADAKPESDSKPESASAEQAAPTAEAKDAEPKASESKAADKADEEKKPQGRRTGIGGVGAGAAAAGAGAAAGATAASGAKKSDDSTEKKPAAKAAGKPAQRKPMAKPAAKTTEKPAAKTTAKTAAKTADKPAARAGSTPAAKSASAGSGTAASAKAAPKKEPIMIGSKSLGQWSKLVSLSLGGLIVAAGILILAARGVTTLPGVPEFLERYTGEYHLPDVADPGFPGWVRWTHFLNIFFMVLIIRSGLQVRHQQKPPAFYTPKKGGKKVSINLWLHTGLDLLWLANGVVFVVLLFVSGHWARIVPTSWEVFPNAVSAMLQYATLEWPMEDAWVNYNALQQLMYFIVVFIAAPLAAITGLRMSEWWPKNATKLNKIYPAPLARAIHFPTMLFFVMFIIVHVFLVFATGMRQNLGYMFAGTDVLGWAGLVWFLVALVVIIGAWFAARPLLLAPIANLFGRVSSR